MVSGAAATLLCLFLTIAIVKSAGLLSGEIAHQRAISIMRDIQFRRSNDYEGLLQAVDRARSLEPFEGAYTDVSAQALLLTAQGIATERRPSLESITEALIDALETNPLDGYLWALLASLYDESGLHGADFHDALKNGLTLGAFDYNTMRQLVVVVIRAWPHLDCNEMAAALEIVRRALQMDDSILGRRNAELGFTLINPYTTGVMDQYNFDLEWANRQTRRCQS